MIPVSGKRGEEEASSNEEKIWPSDHNLTDIPTPIRKIPEAAFPPRCLRGFTPEKLMKNKMSLPVQMSIGMGLGILVGLIFQAASLDVSWLKPFGQIFITLIRMVVVPLVFFTLIAGAASVKDVSTLGRLPQKH